MEKMPYRPGVDNPTSGAQVQSPAATSKSAPCDWRTGLPVLTGRGLALRDLCLSDAASLCALLTAPDVARFISSPPATVEGFEGFIDWTHRQRAAGRYVCFAVVPDGCDAAVGLFQIREIEPGFATAEWGFAVGSKYWGLGLFEQGAGLVVDFAFTHIGTRRLEARAAVGNGRGNGALAKIGAVREAVLRRAFLKDGKHVDQNLWSIVDEDWRRAKAVWGNKVH
jgi:RimJ/RimL family protein N-acetyltransferase